MNEGMTLIIKARSRLTCSLHLLTHTIFTMHWKWLGHQMICLNWWCRFGSWSFDFSRLDANILKAFSAMLRIEPELFFFRKTWPAAAWLPPFLPVSPPCSPSQAAPPASVRSRQPWLERARWIILLFNASNVCAPQPIWEWPNQSVASEGSQTGRPRPGRMVCWSTLWPGITHVLHDT